ncbi:MAG: hypothetical protein HZB38_00780 [Planctomycetes bacterium]|nr:hypothetical protein [Planctomycetota bacterium]
MRKWITAALLLAGFSGASAFAQGLIWKYRQPWTAPWAAHESRVRSCAQPSPLNQIALDDWICGASGPLVRVWWWGTLTHAAQGFRPYYIAIYPNQPGACQPNFSQRLYQICVTPDYRKYVGTDCSQRRVYRMSAVFPAAAMFTQLTGQHYWLQVSEADEESVQVGAENFRWSAHRAIQNCQAVSAFPLTQPILDMCDGQPDDLSFGFSSRDLSGVINPPVGVAIPPVLQLELYDTAGVLRETMSVELDEMGNFNATPEVPDGTYVMVLRGGGLLPMRQTVQLEDGTCTRASFFDIFYGDLNSDNEIGLVDLTTLLSNFGRMFNP